MEECTRECLAIDVSRKLTSEDVLEGLVDLFVPKGMPDHIRSDNGSEFTAKRVRPGVAPPDEAARGWRLLDDGATLPAAMTMSLTGVDLSSVHRATRAA